MSEPVMRADSLVKRYRQGPREIVVLDELELTVQAGERIAIVGSSGSGNSGSGSGSSGSDDDEDSEVDRPDDGDAPDVTSAESAPTSVDD